MRRSRFLVGLVAALASALAVGAAADAPYKPPAPAAPPPPPPTPLALGRCLYDGLPKATRGALAASGPSIDNISAAISGLNPSLMDVARSQCPAPATRADAEKASDAWTAIVLADWSATQLKARHVTQAQLEAAWSQFPADQRRKFEADEDKPPETERANIAPLAKTLGLADDAGVDLVIYWALAQLHLAALGG
jgi:hypothetical protein